MYLDLLLRDLLWVNQILLTFRGNTKVYLLENNLHAKSDHLHSTLMREYTQHDGG